ncbi:protein ROOT HAIR DEFECTIVE 3 homolog 1 isoform X1 [Arachis duranensis]|uniref:Protein ROOT HAIR DEFECTIVE 3 homolog 1 isoform X1 n=1 Tax=Arachis duranensis TaxID=130453 RepID=A0A6P5MTC8_ARADU|nr:protein ROOT HAIR DEFECTIVE 3 homolog 1 isoform X1 [Arachis duranensis]
MSGWGEWSLGDELYSAGSPVPRFAAGALAYPCYPTQLIDGDGKFHVADAENFVKEMELDKCGQSYAVVSIMGPQSSGKSTLLNSLFDTDFKEMNADDGRSRTTKGIWIARCAGIEPCTLVLDLEGTDGVEHGEEDDTSFESQSALFALAVSDIVLINMWCHDIGRHNAANRPLLKTIFQVKMKLFTPRKITLLFVIRDKTRTPFERLKELLLTDIEKIWESFTKSKPDSDNEAALSEFFSVEVVALSSYEHKEEQFKSEVVGLRQQICHSIVQDELARDLYGVVHASDFAYSSQEIWEKIKADKDLHLPSHKVMVATVRCEKIAREKYENLAAKEEWHQLEEDMNRRTTPEFVNRLSLQIDTCLSEYDAETTYYDEGPKSTYRNQLKEKLLQLFEPALVSALEHIGSTILNEFKHTFQTSLNQGEDFYAAASSCIESCLSNFDKACPDVVIEMSNKHKIGVRKKLQCDIVSVLTSSCKEKLKEALSGSIEKELSNGDIIDPWRSIREVLRNEMESTVSQLITPLTRLGMDGCTRKKMIESLEDYARGVVEEKVRNEAKNVLMRMKMCFERRFEMHRQMNRLCIGKDDIPTAAKSARRCSLILLSTLAAIRLDDDDTDDIKEKLEAELLNSSSTATKESSSAKFDPLWLADDSWEQIPSCRKLIGPRSCKKVWDQFMQETEIMISKAVEQGGSTWSLFFKPFHGDSKWSTFYSVASVCLSFAGGAAMNKLGSEALLSLLAAVLAKRAK